METKKIPTKQYLVWIEPDPGDESSTGFFEQFDTIASAIDVHGKYGEVDVYRADIKPIGKYRKQTKIVKIAKRKKKVKV